MPIVDAKVAEDAAEDVAAGAEHEDEESESQDAKDKGKVGRLLCRAVAEQSVFAETLHSQVFLQPLPIVDEVQLKVIKVVIIILPINFSNQYMWFYRIYRVHFPF